MNAHNTTLQQDSTIRRDCTLQPDLDLVICKVKLRKYCKISKQSTAGWTGLVDELL